MIGGSFPVHIYFKEGVGHKGIVSGCTNFPAMRLRPVVRPLAYARGSVGLIPSRGAPWASQGAVGRVIP